MFKCLLPVNTDNDATVILLLQRGDLTAFDNLFRKYHKVLYNNVLKITRHTGAAEDIIQDTFIVLWQKRATIETGKSIAGWLFVSSYNKAINWQKKNLQEAKLQKNIAWDSSEEEASARYAGQRQLLENAIGQLSPQKRRVFELCKLQGKSYEETAIEMNISRHTVKEYLAGAMIIVKDYIHTHPEYRTHITFLIILYNYYSFTK